MKVGVFVEAQTLINKLRFPFALLSRVNIICERPITRRTLRSIFRWEILSAGFLSDDTCQISSSLEEKELEDKFILYQHLDGKTLCCPLALQEIVWQVWYDAPWDSLVDQFLFQLMHQTGIPWAPLHLMALGLHFPSFTSVVILFLSSCDYHIGSYARLVFFYCRQSVYTGSAFSGFPLLPWLSDLTIHTGPEAPLPLSAWKEWLLMCSLFTETWCRVSY